MLSFHKDKQLYTWLYRKYIKCLELSYYKKKEEKSCLAGNTWTVAMFFFANRLCLLSAANHTCNTTRACGLWAVGMDNNTIKLDVTEHTAPLIAVIVLEWSNIIIICYGQSRNVVYYGSVGGWWTSVVSNLVVGWTVVMMVVVDVVVVMMDDDDNDLL